MTTDPRERLLDLLSAEATQGLTEDEIRELRGLLLVFQDEDPDSLAYAAAAADRALDRAPSPPLPPALAQAVERQGRAFFANAPEPYRPPQRPRTPRSTYVAWALVAGLAAVLLWTLRPTREPTLDQLSTALRKLPDSQVFIARSPASMATSCGTRRSSRGTSRSPSAGERPDEGAVLPWIVTAGGARAACSRSMAASSTFSPTARAHPDRSSRSARGSPSRRKPRGG